MKLKRVISAALAVVMAAGLVACSSAGGSSSGKDEVVSIRVWGAEEDQTLLAELISKFEAKYSDVNFDIQLGVESESTAKDTILTDVEAAADVFAFASDQIYDLVNAGALAKLDDYEEAYVKYAGKTSADIKEANSESSVEAATVDDTFYAFPMAGDNSYFLYYDSNVISEEEAKSWDAAAAQDAFGDGYAATKLPTYTLGNDQVPMISAFGYKFIGVNDYAEYIGWAALLAEFLTNEESQLIRFEQRQIGPTNLNAVATDEVQANYAIAAVIQQSEFGVIQKVGGKYWDPAATFGEMLAQGSMNRDDEAGIQKALDELVQGISASIE